MGQLRRVQYWLRRKRGLAVAIEKPVFDLGPKPGPQEPPRPPLIPDFVVSEPSGEMVIAVEMMGFADPEYRTRKERLHPEMAAVCGPVAPHDFHLPSDCDQAERDDLFWRTARDGVSRVARPTV